MADPTLPLSVDDLYGDRGIDEAVITAALNRSLNPRPPTMLYDKMGTLGLSPYHLVLDIGSRDAHHACELAERYGCRVQGVEPVAANLQRAERLIAERQLAELVHSQVGTIESIPALDDRFDFIWCRDMLNHIPDLAAGLAECARVLKASGWMLVYQTFATDLLGADEAARLYPPLAVVAANMAPDFFEACARDAGFVIRERDVIGSEWREWWEETGDHTTSKQLLTIARLRRDRERLLRELGPVNYAADLANCHWGVYQMLGKLEPVCYLLQKVRPASEEGRG
jgi:SAM-dependent methyltransferase